MPDSTVEARNFVKKTLDRCFPVNLAKHLRTSFFYRTTSVAASEFFEVLFYIISIDEFLVVFPGIPENKDPGL